MLICVLLLYNACVGGSVYVLLCSMYNAYTIYHLYCDCLSDIPLLRLEDFVKYRAMKGNNMLYSVHLKLDHVMVDLMALVSA